MRYKHTLSNVIGCGVLLAALALCLAACGGQTGPETAHSAAALDVFPTTPEATVRLYQAYIDSNRFELAQRLSTPRSAPLHQMMANIVADTPSDSSLIHTQFLSLDCIEKQDTAICTCLLRDKYEEYSSEYVLVKTGGRWLVDLPEEDGDFELFEQETLEEWPEQQ